MGQALVLAQSTPFQMLYLVVSVILALSVASERLVEIVKGAIPWLNQQNDTDPTKEGWRKMGVQLLAVAAALVTTFMAQDALSTALLPQGQHLSFAQLAGLGILASGGSSMWNSVLVYLIKVKDIKEAQAAQIQSDVRAAADQAAKAQLKTGN